MIKYFFWICFELEIVKKQLSFVLKYKTKKVIPYFNFLSLALFLIFSACQTQADLSQLYWILGKWQINESNNFEEWEKVSDDLYRGKGYETRKNDTLLTETINIVQRGKEVFYIPTVTNQNEAQPVEFKLVSTSATELIFENKNHDFPQRIIYIKNGERQIDARIEGEREGRFSKVIFQLKKVN